ncbi:MAG: bifunctional oligoribonuclease/PAP phosphatase NrnA [Phycisphaerae bacterium]|nr:bifunctional oligoribonuclease/PAP phosphatase NrnA [Phycisphaerae bacterium]
MTSSDIYQKAVTLIEQSNSILITTHIRPDGDACGCVRALQETLTGLGKSVRLLFMSPLASWYQALFDEKPPILGNDIVPEQLNDHYQDIDLVILVDTDSRVQLSGFSDWLENCGRKVLVIDHHITGDRLGDVMIVDTTAAAAGEIVFDLLKFAGWPITERIAESIFIALSTDTGWFKFGNTDSRIFQTAAKLIDAGAKPNEIYGLLYQSFTPSRIYLMGRMLEHLQLHADGRIATQYILRRDFDKTGATGADTENLIDECQRIQTVQAAALFVELADGGFRCSLRSKGTVDVRKIAQKYGGGGHTLASGVNLQGPLENALQTVVNEIMTQLE